MLSAFLIPFSFAIHSSPSGRAENDFGDAGASQPRGRYFVQSKERWEEYFFFALSALPRSRGRGKEAALADEDSVIARGLAGAGGSLEVGDFLEGGRMGMDSADASWRPYLLCSMDSAAE